jgi:hypothetical protein
MKTVWRKPGSALFATLLAVGLLAGCNSSDGSRNVVAEVLTGPQTAEADGLSLLADPEEIVIDLGDPNTPVDPGTGSAYGESTLTATALDEQGAPMVGVELLFSTDGGTLASSGGPVTTDDQGMATDVLRLMVDDPDSVLVSVVEGDRTVSVTVTKQVVQPNRPPVADAGDDIQAFCESPDGAVVTLDGSASSDPDSTEGTNDDIVSFEWYEEFGGAGEQLLGEGETLQLTFGFGLHAVTLQVADSQGETDTDDLTVEIVDDTAPVLWLEVTPSVLWDPDHIMVDVHADLVVEDCSPVTITLVSITANEPINDIGDGDTEPDIMGAEYGTEDYDFQLRAERSGAGNDRIYTVEYLVVDAAGLQTTAYAEVVVPHDQGD